MTAAVAFRDVRNAWRLRSSITLAAFVVAACVPAFAGAARTADLAGGLYLAVAAIALAFAVGTGGLPSLAQGAFVAIGAVTAAHLLAAGVPTAPAALGGAAAAGISAFAVGAAFLRLPRASFAAATWIVAWLVALGIGSITWFLGGSEGIVVTSGPSPSAHYELALALTALAGLAYAALARAPLGLRLAAARDREAAALALGVPVERARVTAIALTGTVAGLAGALGVQLAGVGDPSQYGPFLSFKLFVVVLIGGAAASFGAAAGVVVLGALSVAADAIGSLENVAAARSHTLLAAVMLLGVVSLGFDGILRPGRRTWPTSGGTAMPSARAAALVARALRKHYGALVAVDDVSVALEPGTVTALVGPNGSGKTTVLRLLAGAVEPDAGTVEHGGVVRTLQATSVFPALTTLEHLVLASAVRRRHGGVVRSLLSTPKARAEERRFAAEGRATLDRFGVPANTPASELTVTDQRILMLLTAAATGAPALLVDEPTAGASATEARRIGDVVTALRAEGRAILVVEHNLAVVRSIADRVIALDAGRVVETS